VLRDEGVSYILYFLGGKRYNSLASVAVRGLMYTWDFLTEISHVACIVINYTNMRIRCA
jgi:hypothetical protein